MIWVTWRQHRAQLITALVALALVAAVMIPNGLSMQSAFRATGLERCLAQRPGSCAALAGTFMDQFSANFLIPLFLVVPALVGAFWGAPLVARELEQGTHRLAWTQSVTRTRWLVIKVALLGAGTVAAVGVMTLMLRWWSGPLVATADDRFEPGIFDLVGVVPVAYGLFAFSAGVAAGTILRRTLAAMAVTLGLFIAVRAAVVLLLRPNFVHPLAASYGLDVKPGPTTLRGAWQTSTETMDAAGRIVGHGGGLQYDLLVRDCPNLAAAARDGLPDTAAVQACIHSAGVHVVSAYQPADRYWLFQGIEGAIFVAFAFVLVLLTLWWVRRRLS